MAKWQNDAMLDAGLQYVRDCDRIILCSQQPTTYAEATTTYALATANATPNTDFPLANGDVSGRKVTVAAKSNVSVTATGTGNHVALVRTADSSLRYVTTCTAQAVVSGNLANLGAWDIEIADAA